MDINKFEIVANGNGASFAGMMSRKIKSSSNGAKVVPRIIAIEPKKASNDQLTTTDATFVMSIYTEDLFSDKNVEDHVRFYVNGGKFQPKCPSIFLLWPSNKICSNKLAQKYWLEAVNSKSATIFPARKCKDYEEFEDEACDAAAPIGYMNPKVANTLRGNYYLNVNDASPYSKATADP